MMIRRRYTPPTHAATAGSTVPAADASIIDRGHRHRRTATAVRVVAAAAVNVTRRGVGQLAERGDEADLGGRVRGQRHPRRHERRENHRRRSGGGDTRTSLVRIGDSGTERREWGRLGAAKGG